MKLEPPQIHSFERRSRDEWEALRESNRLWPWPGMSAPPFAGYIPTASLVASGVALVLLDWSVVPLMIVLREDYLAEFSLRVLVDADLSTGIYEAIHESVNGDRAIGVRYGGFEVVRTRA